MLVLAGSKPVTGCCRLRMTFFISLYRRSSKTLRFIKPLIPKTGIFRCNPWKYPGSVDVSSTKDPNHSKKQSLTDPSPFGRTAWASDGRKWHSLHYLDT